MALHPRHEQWLESRRISVDLARRLGLETVVRDGTAWLSVPYVRDGKVVNHKYRRTEQKDHRMDPGGEMVLWNVDCLKEKNHTPVVICEGEWDAMVALSSGYRAVSVPNGSSSAGDGKGAYEYLWAARELLNAVPQFILAVDSDRAGLALRKDLISYLGADRCRFVEYGADCKDLNETLCLYGAEAVSDALNNAQPVPVTGLYRLDQFPQLPDLPSTPIGIPGLDDLFGLVPPSFTVWTGWAGHGKSSLLMKAIANLLKTGTNVAVASLETLPRPILERKLRAAFYERPDAHPLCREEGPADAIFAERLTVIAQSPTDEELELSMETLIELATIAVLRNGVKLLVIDPWNEVEHKRGGTETETDYVCRSIMRLKQFAKRYDCAVWVVAHPRKPHSDGNPKPPSLYDLAGSAHFANKADYGIVVHRSDLAHTGLSASVVKVRMGYPGRIGRAFLDFNPMTSSYEAMTYGDGA